MIRRPPRSTLDRSSAASDVYKRQRINESVLQYRIGNTGSFITLSGVEYISGTTLQTTSGVTTVSYTHLRAHETVLDLVCRLLLEKTKNNKKKHKKKKIHR